MFHVLKAGYLDSASTLALSNTHTLIQHMSEVMPKCSIYNFSWLRTYDKNYATQKRISKDKQLAFMACLFHYDMDVSLVMRLPTIITLGPKEIYQPLLCV